MLDCWILSRRSGIHALVKESNHVEVCLARFRKLSHDVEGVRHCLKHMQLRFDTGAMDRTMQQDSRGKQEVPRAGEKVRWAESLEIGIERRNQRIFGIMIADKQHQRSASIAWCAG